MKRKTVAIIPAGGSGRRFGSEMPKQFIELFSRPILMHTLERFATSEIIDSVILAVPEEWIGHTKDLVAAENIAMPIFIVRGGRERQDSVANALQCANEKRAEIVLVHDAVRPVFSDKLIDRVVCAASKYGAAVPALMPKETIKVRNDEYFVMATPDRSSLCSIQTPQGFRAEILTEAYSKLAGSGFVATDDASVAEYAGFPVRIVEGEETNIKITTPFDLKIAELGLASIA